VYTVPHTKKKKIHSIVGKISNKFTAGQKYNTETCFTINRNVNSQNNRPSYENPHQVHKFLYIALELAFGLQ
jgi:hypothetical protein